MHLLLAYISIGFALYWQRNDQILGSCADYGFEYSDEEVEEEDVDIENQYYNSKGNVSLVDAFSE